MGAKNGRRKTPATETDIEVTKNKTDLFLSGPKKL